jgi:hypothetical protein
MAVGFQSRKGALSVANWVKAEPFAKASTVLVNLDYAETIQVHEIKAENGLFCVRCWTNAVNEGDGPYTLFSGNQKACDEWIQRNVLSKSERSDTNV